jgi:hypothetical protein
LIFSIFAIWLFFKFPGTFGQVWPSQPEWEETAVWPSQPEWSLNVKGGQIFDKFNKYLSKKNKKLLKLLTLF